MGGECLHMCDARVRGFPNMHPVGLSNFEMQALGITGHHLDAAEVIVIALGVWAQWAMVEISHNGRL